VDLAGRPLPRHRGAYSIDRQYRKLDSGRWGWFKEEVITPAQAKRATAGGPADVLPTHDAPARKLPMVAGMPTRYDLATLHGARHV
jgi:hypothetical protein